MYYRLSYEKKLLSNVSDNYRKDSIFISTCFWTYILNSDVYKYSLITNDRRHDEKNRDGCNLIFAYKMRCRVVSFYRFTEQLKQSV